MNYSFGPTDLSREAVRKLMDETVPPQYEGNAELRLRMRRGLVRRLVEELRLTEDELRLACEAVTRLPYEMALRRMSAKLSEALAKHAKVGDVTAVHDSGHWRFYRLGGPDMTLEEAREYVDAKYGGAIHEQNRRLLQAIRSHLVEEVPC